MTGLVRPYPKGSELLKKVKDEAAAGESAGGNVGLCTTHFNEALLLQSEKHNALFFIETAAVHTEDSTKDKKTAALCCSREFCVYSTAPRKADKRSNNALPAVESTNKKVLTAQVTRTKTYWLSLKALSLSTMSLLLCDLSD